MLHWNRKKAKQILIMQILGLLFALFTILLIISKPLSTINSENVLEVESSHRMPLRELSGLDYRVSDEGIEILVIGDRKAKIAQFNLGTGVIKEFPFDEILLRQFSLCQSRRSKSCGKLLKKLFSDWEALRLDRFGRVFVLQEHSDTVLVLDRTMSSIEKVLNFDILAGFPSKVQDSSKKFLENSYGEGLLLLHNGHFVVAKERNPIALIEYGPKGSVSSGINSSTVLKRSEEFDLGGVSRSEYTALATWQLGGSSKCDFSDLEFYQGSILVLSQQCQQIFVFEGLDKGDKALLRTLTLSLPSHIKNPEALAVLPDGRIVVGSDLRSKDDNLFILKSPFKGKTSQ